MTHYRNGPAAVGRRLLLAAGVSLIILSGTTAPRPAEAQLSTYCVNCSTMLTQLLQYAKEAQSMATQLQQYQTELQQYANMVTNTVAIPQQVWSTAQSDILRVQALSSAASLLSGNSGSLITRLQSASGYLGQAGSLTDMPGQITGYQQTIGNNLSTMGKALGLQQGMEANNAALLSSLQTHSQSAVGQMQALQAGNELAHQQATQLLQIQATLTSTAQMQATQMAVDADRRASEDAALMKFNSGATVVATPGQQW
jgi:P-type conjugative transfer protein TrbJ